MFFKHIKTYQISVCSWEKDIHTRKHYVLLLQPLINLCNLCSFCFFLMYLWDKGFRFYHFQQIMKNSHTVLICNRHWIVKLQSSLTVQSKSVRLGVDTKMTVQTPPHLTPPHHTNSTCAPRASEKHSLMTTKYSVMNNNKQGHNNNNNNDSNNINNKIISFRSLRLTFIDSN